MLRRAVVCFANVQEGRDPKVLRELSEAASSVPGAWLVRMFSDRTFHRSGLCIVGAPDEVGQAVFSLVAKAQSVINLVSRDRLADQLSHHHIGAVDLLPFHPLGEATMDDAAQVSRQVAERVGSELQIPVLTYGAAHPTGRALAALRKQTTFFKKGPGEAQTPSSTVVVPDFGPASPRPESGITVCGATPYVLNFNIALSTTNLPVGQKLAKAIRAATPGGLSGVEAMAYVHAGPGGSQVVEVACNLKECTSEDGCPEAVLGRVAALAEAEGVAVLHSYKTNPTPQELHALVSSPGGIELGLRVAAGLSAVGDQGTQAALDWRVPPGDAADAEVMVDTILHTKRMLKQ